MKYALVLESNPQTCNQTAALVASLGYLVTPVFNPKKALHAAHMIQFDLIVTCTTSIPADRRSLTSELARCSPDALLILVTEPGSRMSDSRLEGVNLVVDRTVTAQELKAAVDACGTLLTQPFRARREFERRRRAVD